MCDPQETCNGMDLTCPADVTTSCTAGQMCANGMCAATCSGAGMQTCGMPAMCVNTNTDANHCGRCNNACGMGRTCMAGNCVCNAGTMMCGAACANLQTDSANCGRCGNVCPMNQMCVAGACAIACPAPNRICSVGAMMSCVNQQTDVNNCGACGTVCSAANGVASCAAGACGVASCNAGFRNCNNSAMDGCEVNINTDIANCGACGTVCAAANGMASCSNGACGLASCNAGFSNCDNNAANGCEAALQRDNNNCGACGNRCGAGLACVNGSCLACGSTYTGMVAPVTAVSFGGHCYMGFTERLSWMAARDRCAAVGGYLAVPSSAQENAAVRSSSDASLQAWIGYFDNMNGAPNAGNNRTLFTGVAPGTNTMNYNNFGGGEPNNNPGEDCVAYFEAPFRPPGDTWNDAVCSINYPYICEFDSL